MTIRVIVGSSSGCIRLHTAIVGSDVYGFCRRRRRSYRVTLSDKG
mgnify:CR=1 FL=1|jgi:hypothetical protein